MEKLHNLRLIVTGGRNFGEQFIPDGKGGLDENERWRKQLGFVYDRLDNLHHLRRIRVIVQGGARGADKVSRVWASEKGVPFLNFDAQWDNYGKRAGMIRNVKMVEEGAALLGAIDLVLAFPGGVGTAGMVETAETYGITVWDLRKEFK